MELFQLVAGIIAVKKVMRDRYDDQPLPPIESGYTPLEDGVSRTCNGFEVSTVANQAASASESEKCVA